MKAISVWGRLDKAAFHKTQTTAALLADAHKRDLTADITPMLEREWSEFVLQEKVVRGDAWGLKEDVFITVDGELVPNAAAFCAWVTEAYSITADSGLDFEEMATAAYQKYITNPKRDFVFMDIKVGDTDAGKAVIELFSDICPKTCENFKQLCIGAGKCEGKGDTELAFKGTLFHRIQADGWAQGGDIVDGTGKNGHSIYGATFADENFIVKHSGRGVIAMANSDLHTNASQFLVSFRALGWMNEKYVAFGQLVEGSATLKAIEEAETSSSGRPTRDIVIADCGEYVA